jgi:MbtH protein
VYVIKRMLPGNGMLSKGGALTDLQGAPTYEVVINHEEQYSIWPLEQQVPLGWSKVGIQGTKDECLDYIERVWTDMRPLSVRRWSEAQ